MRTAIAIIERDLKERRFIFFAAIIFSLIPFLTLAVVPSLRANAQGFVAIFAATEVFWFPVAVAIGLGATMIGGDLTARRLSFYFSKPISSRSLWYGKFVAALITLYVSMAIVGTPGAIYTWNYRLSQWMDRRSVLIAALIAAPAVLLIAHVLSMMIRSRSPWIAVDAIAIGIAATAAWFIAAPLISGMAVNMLVRIAAITFAAAMAAFLVSGAWHLSRGRTDRIANHIELSKFLWSAIAGILLLAGASVMWIIHATPDEIANPSIYSASAGGWIATGGFAPHRMDYHSTFLTNIETGKFVRIPSADLQFGAIAFSRDGRHVAWTHVASIRDRRLEVWTRSLEPMSDEHRTGIAASDGVQLVMSDDGMRIATLDSGILNVADASSGRSLASARLAASRRWEAWMYFAGPDVVRVFVNITTAEPRIDVPRMNSLAIYELDARARRLTQTGTLNVMARHMSVATTPDGARMIVHAVKAADPADSVFVADARTGTRITSLPPDPINSQTPLPDGSMVALVHADDGWHVRLESPGGTVRDVNIGSSHWPRISAIRGDRVLVGMDNRAVLVNLTSGTIVRNIPNVRLATIHHAYEDDPRLFVPTGPLIAAVDASWHLVRVDVNTGAVTPLPR